MNRVLLKYCLTMLIEKKEREKMACQRSMTQKKRKREREREREREKRWHAKEA